MELSKEEIQDLMIYVTSKLESLYKRIDVFKINIISSTNEEDKKYFEDRIKAIKTNCIFYESLLKKLTKLKVKGEN